MLFLLFAIRLCIEIVNRILRIFRSDWLTFRVGINDSLVDVWHIQPHHSNASTALLLYLCWAGACVSAERECVYVWVPYAMRCMSCELFSRFVFALIYAHLTQTHSKHCTITSTIVWCAVLNCNAYTLRPGDTCGVHSFFSFFSFYLIRFRWLPVLHTQVYITRVSSYVMAVLMCCIPNKIFRQVYLESV